MFPLMKLAKTCKNGKIGLQENFTPWKFVWFMLYIFSSVWESISDITAKFYRVDDLQIRATGIGLSRLFFKPGYI